MEIINSDKVDWTSLFLEHELIAINYQPLTDCPGCGEVNDIFQDLSEDSKFKKIEFLWVDSRNNPIAEQFIKKTQKPFIAIFKEGFLIECNNISSEKEMRELLKKLIDFKIKL